MFSPVPLFPPSSPLDDLISHILLQDLTSQILSPRPYPPTAKLPDFKSHILVLASKFPDGTSQILMESSEHESKNRVLSSAV
eukprot:1310406-Amorphochlora_amoeboformis.AAC.1